MNQPITAFVDSGKAVARLSGPLVLGDTYAVAFSGLSAAEAASAPEMIVLGPKPREIAARSGEDGVLAMTTKPCVEAFAEIPPPPFPRPKQFPHPPPLPNPPVHWRGGPHGSARMHFYVVAGGQTLAQGDLVLLWAPFEFDEAGEPIQLKGADGATGPRGRDGAQGRPGRNGVYVAMDGLYAFHVSEGGDHPEDGHLWLHAQDESTLYAHDANGNYLLDGDGERIPLYYVGEDGHLRYRFFFQGSTHVELDLGKVVTREGIYAFHVSDGSDGEPAGHLMLHGQDLSQLYARDGQGELILDGDGNPIPLFHIDANGHLHFTFYGADGQAHESLDLGDVRGPALTWADLTDEQKAALKGETGATGAQGPKGDPLTWADLTDAQKASLKGAKGDPGEDGMSKEEIVALVNETMGEADDAPTAGSGNWVTSGGLWSVEQAILSRILALATRIDNLRAQVGGAFHFLGSVDTVADLPAANNNQGDVWNVRQDATHPDGMNYAWTGSAWDALGGLGDLSAYLRVADLDDALHNLGSGTWFDGAVIGGIDSASSLAAAAMSEAQTATANASAADSKAEQAYSMAASKPSDSDVASAISTAVASLAAVARTGAADDVSLPSGVSGNSLGAWVGSVDQFLGTLPSPSDMVCIQGPGGNLYTYTAGQATLLLVPPSINGSPLGYANLLPYDNVLASSITLAPHNAVYRADLNSDGTFPTISDSGIATAAAYYQFELEMSVPSTVPTTITGPTGWTWIDGHGLPDPADLSGGETICISVRLDCTARTFLASVWRVA